MKLQNIYIIVALAIVGSAFAVIPQIQRAAFSSAVALGKQTAPSAVRPVGSTALVQMDGCPIFELGKQTKPFKA